MMLTPVRIMIVASGTSPSEGLPPGSRQLQLCRRRRFRRARFRRARFRRGGADSADQAGHLGRCQPVIRGAVAEFSAPAPNRLWVADPTYVKTHAGSVCVAYIVDVFSRLIVGWQAARSLRPDLAVDALEMAVSIRRLADADVS